MRRLLVALQLLLLVAAIAMPFRTTRAQSPQNFIVSNFEADYYLSRGSENQANMKVTEKISAVFPDFDQNHGIVRMIPSSYKGYSVYPQIDSVTDQSGNNKAYKIDRQSDFIVLKIGDANTYVHGLQEYEITYNLKNVIAFEPDRDELYWDINGDQWLQPMKKVTARVHVPPDLNGALRDEQFCFAGIYGQNTDNCTTNRMPENGGTVIFAQAFDLKPRQTLTVAAAFDDNTFAIARSDQNKKKFGPLLVAAGFSVPITAAAVFVMKRWIRYGRDAKGKGVIVPQYTPPQVGDVLKNDYIVNEKIRTRAISARLIELAVAGNLRLYEVPDSNNSRKNSYELELVKAPDNLDAQSRKVLEGIFGVLKPGKQVNISKLGNQLYSLVGSLNKDLAEETYAEGYFTQNPKSAINRMLVIGVVLFVVSFPAGILAAVSHYLIGLPFSIAASGVLIMIFSYIMPAKTPKGTELKEYFKGMKDYISLAEKDRIAFLQSPNGEGLQKKLVNNKSKIELFEKLLPYAMVLGLENRWAGQFKDLYQQPPEWYSGNVHNFNAVALGHSLGQFSSSSSSMFTSPSSSSSGGTSGGGFSGGGGGGGGGGGW